MGLQDPPGAGQRLPPQGGASFPRLTQGSVHGFLHEIPFVARFALDRGQNRAKTPSPAIRSWTASTAISEKPALFTKVSGRRLSRRASRRAPFMRRSRLRHIWSQRSYESTRRNQRSIRNGSIRVGSARRVARMRASCTPLRQRPRARAWRSPAGSRRRFAPSPAGKAWAPPGCSERRCRNGSSPPRYGDRPFAEESPGSFSSHRPSA